MTDPLQFYGRRIIYIVARFFSGVSGSAFLSVAGGTVGDLFHRNELGGPMMFYTASPFIGPEIGPL
jgi:MFS family permease